MVLLHARPEVDALGVQPGVDRIGAHSLGMQIAPDCSEPLVVHVPAERTRTMPGGECSRLVKEEELRELAGLQQRAAMPPAELELTRDPALAVEAPPNAPMRVVEAAAVAVDEATGRNGDELAERCDAVLAQKRILLEAATLGGTTEPAPARLDPVRQLLLGS